MTTLEWGEGFGCRQHNTKQGLFRHSLPQTHNNYSRSGTVSSRTERFRSLAKSHLQNLTTRMPGTRVEINEDDSQRLGDGLLRRQRTTAAKVTKTIAGDVPWTESSMDGPCAALFAGL